MSPLSRIPRRPRRILPSLACALLLLSLVAGRLDAYSHRSDVRAGAALLSDDKTEYKVKAAFLFNFLKYTTWPKGTFEKDDTPLELVVVGKDPYGKILDEAVGGKKVGKRKVVIRRVDEVTEKTTVHALLLGELEAKARSKVYAAVADRAVLTIGDSKGDAGKDTATASLYVEKGKVRFEVSLDSMKRSKLSISSQLLKLADIVEERK